MPLEGLSLTCCVGDGRGRAGETRARKPPQVFLPSRRPWPSGHVARLYRRVKPWSPTEPCPAPWGRDIPRPRGWAPPSYAVAGHRVAQSRCTLSSRGSEESRTGIGSKWFKRRHKSNPPGRSIPWNNSEETKLMKFLKVDVMERSAF